MATLGLAITDACDALADGTLGYMARPDDDVAAVIADTLVNPRPDPAQLATEVAKRFGRAAFTRRIDTLIGEVTV